MMRSGRAQLISLLWAMVGVGTEGAQHMNLSNGRAEPEAERWLRFFEQNLCVDKWTSCPGLGSAGQLAS